MVGPGNPHIKRCLLSNYFDTRQPADRAVINHTDKIAHYIDSSE